MISGERVEGPQLVPAGAQLLRRVPGEAADVCRAGNNTRSPTYVRKCLEWFSF